MRLIQDFSKSPDQISIGDVSVMNDVDAGLIVMERKLLFPAGFIRSRQNDSTRQSSLVYFWEILSRLEDKITNSKLRLESNKCRSLVFV